MHYDPKPLVTAGVAFLDSLRESRPELAAWEQAVDLETLNINYGWHCMLGQLFNHYTWACKDLKLNVNAVVSCGFRHDGTSPVSEHDQCVALTAEWKRVIHERLAA